MPRGTESRLFAHAAAVVHGARARHLRPCARHSHGRYARAKLHSQKRNAVHDTERVRVRLWRLCRNAGDGEAASRMGRMEEEAKRGAKRGPLDWLGYRLDARFRHK